MTKESPSHVPGSVDDDGLADEDRIFLERLARWLAERRMAVPAVLFLESVKPVTFIGSQMLYFFEPIVKSFVGGRGYTRFAAIMERRENVEVFLTLIETADHESRQKEKEEKR